MDQIGLRESGIEALRSFNNAIVTSRLYPPTAPQVTNAVKFGYKGLRLFLRQHGKLAFIVKNRRPYLGEFPVDQETIASFSNLVVFRQLEILEVSRLLIEPSMDRFAFGQILSVFTAKTDKIRREGGGIEFITSLGLSSYFPEPESDKTLPVDVPEKVEKTARKTLHVEQELVACLLGKDNRHIVQQRLQENFANLDRAVDILAAAIGQVLRGLQKKKAMRTPEIFADIFLRSEQLIAEKDRRFIILSLSKMLLENLQEPTLCVLLSQDYPKGTGEALYGSLVAGMNADLLEKIINIYRQQLIVIERRFGAAAVQAKLIKEAFTKLLATPKGKQFVGLEKARQIIEKGEEQRVKQRIVAGIQGIINGNTTLLQNAELLKYLPGAIRQMVDVDDKGNLDTLLLKIVDQFQGDETLRHPQLLNTITSIAESFISGNKWHYLDLLLQTFLGWVRDTDKNDELFERVVIILQVVMQHSWQDGNISQGDEILILLHKIRSGRLKKSLDTRLIVGRVQDRGIERSSLPDLLRKCLAEPRNDELSYRLILQGPVALRFLVESLITAENAAYRFKIIDLLTNNDPFVPEIVLERIQEHMPWYGKRNLIKLLAETGGENDAEAILVYLNHEDFRVQREAFLCIYKIAGKGRKRLLLMALADSSELIKVQIINGLVRVCDPEVASHLTGLLAEYGNFSEKNRDPLLLQLFDTLARCPCPVAHKGVENFVKGRGRRGAKKISAQAWAAAEKALEALEKDQERVKKRHVQANKLRKNAIKQAAKRGKTSSSQRVITGLAEEQAIRTLLGKGDDEKARKQLVRLIEQTAQTRNFVQAEKLREWLIDIDETALVDIIRAAEIISEKKAAAIDKSHLEIWSELYEVLTTEEFSAMYHSLQHKRYENEEIVVHQGALQTSLYFINSGKVKLFYQDKGDNILVKTMGKGEIVGAGSFFDASVWTISVASVGASDISLLRLEKMQQWSDEFPGLESRLRDFCARFESVVDVIKQSSLERRKYERHRISGRVTTLLLDNQGQTTGVSSNVELFDISPGGVSYLLRITRRENGRLILGRKVKVMIPVGKNKGQTTGCIGDILAVKDNQGPESDYSVHVKFETILSRSQLDEILTGTTAIS